MDRPGLTGERAIGLFLLAFLALNPPILSIKGGMPLKQVSFILVTIRGSF